MDQVDPVVVDDTRHYADRENSEENRDLPKSRQVVAIIKQLHGPEDQRGDHHEVQEPSPRGLVWR